MTSDDIVVRVYQDTEGWIVLQIGSERGAWALLDRKGARDVARMLKRASRTRSPVPIHGLEV